jgi:cbb3-type cytochrome c oxidase subunit II
MNSRVASWLVVALVPVAVLVAMRAGNSPSTESGVALGRRVFVAEGCIHCHSQYVRPGSPDEVSWGPARDPDFSRHQSPALIGNRRQGPDLMNVGVRRPRDWQQRHLIEPRSVVPASRMPGYAHLFAPDDARGPALLDYLDSLGREPGAAGPRGAPGGVRNESDIAGAAPGGQAAVRSPP